MGISPSRLIPFASPEYAPIIETLSGPVRGKVVHTSDKGTIDAYLGIPYAKPPVGPLRFQKPQPAEPWTEVKDCIQFGPRSPQLDLPFAQFLHNVPKCESGSLNLNVIAPRWKCEEFATGLPVMVWIHGGGFAMHSSSNYGDVNVARNLCVKDVVFVSINYRLGLLGFLTTNDEICPGNMGLWDQTLALKWVKENISSFGGDPSNITVFGQSAGGASTDLLCLSPHSRDLFQKAIPMAGTAENEFAIRTKEFQATVCFAYAKHIGYDGPEGDTKAMFEFLVEQPTAKLEIGIGSRRGFKNEKSGPLLFVPVLDYDFFPKTLHELREEAPKKSIMAGTTLYEGLLFVSMSPAVKNMADFRRSVNVSLRRCDYGEKTDELREKVLKFYTEGIDENDKESLAHKNVVLCGDYTINNGMMYYVNKMKQLGHDVYFYSFEYHNPNGFGWIGYMMPFKAATHCYEIRYILGKGVFSKFRPDHNDLSVIDQMVGYFTNFAKYGNPNGKILEGQWKPHDPENPFRHMRIDLNNSGMAEDYHDKRAEFWKNEIYPHHFTMNKCLGGTT